MMHIHPARKGTGVYFINGIGINLKDYRNGKRYGLTSQEVKFLDQYIKDYKLGLS